MNSNNQPTPEHAQRIAKLEATVRAMAAAVTALAEHVREIEADYDKDHADLVAIRTALKAI